VCSKKRRPERQRRSSTAARYGDKIIRGAILVFLFGQTSKLFIDDFHSYALYVLGGLVLLGIAIWLITLIRHRRKVRAHGLK